MTDRALTALDAFPATGNDAAAVKSIAPGFRFHPTDEELISYYLKRKVQGKPMRIDAIREVDVYKHEPSDLPERSRLKTKDQTWFFFSALEKKYSNGALINRATNKGYWKHTGNDKKIKGGDGQLIGKIKKLVFYRGRVPKDKQTNWRIHEYRLVENDIELGSYVLCRLFHKERVKPPSGYSYAPFLEEEWDDDDDDDDDGTRAPVPSVVHANRINKIQQENHPQSKNLFDLNELPREFEMDEDPKTVDMDDNNDEPPTREGLIFNKEAPLPLVQYKRKRQIDYFESNHKSQSTQDHCSVETISSVATMLEKNETELVATVVPTSSSTDLINDLDKEKQQMAVERKTNKLDMMCAELMINVLKGQNDELRAEIEELKKNKRNKRQCS